MTEFKAKCDDLSPWNVDNRDFTDLFCGNCDFWFCSGNDRPCCECFVKPSKFVPKVESV